MQFETMVENIHKSWKLEPHVQIMESQDDVPANWMRIRLSQVACELDLSDYIHSMEGMGLDIIGTWIAGITDALLEKENILAAVRCLRAGIEYVVEHFDVEWEKNEYWQDMAGWMSEMEQGIVFTFGGDMLAVCAGFVDPDTGVAAYTYTDMR